MLLTLLLTLFFILAVCLLLYAAVGLIQNKKLFTTAPKDIQAAAQDHPERFRGAHALGWKLAVISLLLMVGAFVYGSYDGVKRGFSFWQHWLRFHAVYQEAMGEAKEGKAMGSILPALFLAIAVLTMVTTMHRIATKEKTQIGVLKALGFKNRTILLHDSCYGLFIGIVGAALGAVLGYFVCKLVMSENGMMGTYFDMPDWTAATPAFCYPVIAGTILLLALISFLSVHAQLRGTTADALRPYTPKKMKQSFLEKLPFFRKMGFATKWNLRDLMRHKSRFAMTLVGIIGCMVLMVGGLGMRDTMAGFLDLLDHGVSHYATKVNLVENTDPETAKQLITELDGDWESYSGISIDGCTATLDIVHNDHKRFSVIDEDNREIDLRDDGVYLCLRLADRAKIGESIEFSPYGSEESYRVKVVGYNRSIMTESVTMTDRCAEELGIQYSVSAIPCRANATANNKARTHGSLLWVHFHIHTKNKNWRNHHVDRKTRYVCIWYAFWLDWL